MNAPSSPLKTLAAAAAIAGAAAVVPAHAASGDDMLDRAVGQFKSLHTRGAWINPYLPVTTAPSADQQMRTMLAGYTREALDRGGWANPFVRGDHYAVGEPLIAAAIGSGVTSQGGPAREAGRLLAAR